MIYCMNQIEVPSPPDVATALLSVSQLALALSELNAALVADAPASSVDVLGALLQRAQARWRDVDVTLESRVFGSRTEALSSQPDSEL